MIPFGDLVYLYVGTANFERDLAYYRDMIGAPVVWNFSRFGAKVAALRLGAGPLFLIADHRPAPSCLPIYAVKDLAATLATLAARGFRAEGPPFEIPDGPCQRFHDPSGNALALLQIDRPNALVAAHEDPSNPHVQR